MRTFEDFPVGLELRFGAYEVTREEIIAFAQEFDPQPFHLDDEAAQKSLLQGLAASGYHTCAMHMRLICDGYLNESMGLGAPGIDEIRWLHPVRPGMRLSAVHKVVGTRVPRSRPELGFVQIESQLMDQTGLVVMTLSNAVMFGRRSHDVPERESEGVMPARRALEPDPPQIDPALHATRFGPYYDDVVIGARVDLGSYHFDEARILRFARAYDPQPFHLSDEAASKMHFGRLAASGWHTAAAYMSLYVRARDKVRAAARARGEEVVSNGPSPGLRDLRWLKPVLVGDTLTYETTVTGKRAHLRPGWGIITSRATGTNQHGVRVYQASGAVLLPMRP